MKPNDIEKMLSPKHGFRAPKDLKERIIASANAEAEDARETAKEMRRTAVWWKYATSIAAAAAIVAVAIVVRPGSTPMYAAEALFQRAAEMFLHTGSFSATFDVRTGAEGNFSYINMAKGFVEHEMTVMPEKGLWVLEKSGRKAVRDGEYIWQWMPGNGLGWKYDGWALGAIEDFAFMLDPYALLKNEEAMAKANPHAVIRESEKDGVITLVVETPADGEFSENDYMKNRSIAESDTRREYTFEKSSGKLLSLEVSAKAFGIRRTVVKMTDIDYFPSIDMTDFAVPAQTEWIDLTKVGLENAAEILPVDEFRNISPEQAVGKMFAAMKDWDEDLLRVVLYGSGLNRLEKTYRGCELLEVGDSFPSGLYVGVFVPCKVRLADGKTESLKVAIRNDYLFGAWTYDGGML